jgi:hypothetical protein
MICLRLENGLSDLARFRLNTERNYKPKLQAILKPHYVLYTVLVYLVVVVLNKLTLQKMDSQTAFET